MTNLFQKAIVFTDIHFGHKNNSLQHNTDCTNFINWICETGRESGCDACFFLGDYHHNRAAINLQTLHHSVQALERLSKSFSQTFFIPGNHDLYYKEKREIHGVGWASHIPNIVIVNDWFSEGNVVIAPWMVQDDHKKLSKQRGQYMFGHFELPTFMMNARIEMPDTGEIRLEEFGTFDSVFSGHFHIRQQKGNIHYIGNAFPHNFGDAGDDRRGAMILEWGEKPEYHTWPGQPIYRVHTLSDVLNDPDSLLLDNLYIRVHLDIDISYEEASFIKETFMKQYKIREMSLIPIKHNTVQDDLAPGEIKFESVDQIVSHQLSAISSEFYDPALLLKIYQTL